MFTTPVCVCAHTNSFWHEGWAFLHGGRLESPPQTHLIQHMPKAVDHLISVGLERKTSKWLHCPQAKP